MTLSVIIVGAGIAGLAAGIALREYADVTILESAVVLKEVGAAFTLTPNALRILHAWGLRPDVEGGTPIDEMRMWTEKGSIKFDMTFEKQHDGVNSMAIHRADMHAALLKAATEGGPGRPCILHLGKKVTNVDPVNATVTTADGSTYSADVVIGADGIRSAVRPFVLPTSSISSPQPIGESAYRLLVPSSAVEKAYPGLLEETGFTGPRVHLMQTPTRKLIVYPCRGGEFINLVLYVPDSELSEETSTKWTKQGDLGSLLKAFEFAPAMWTQLMSCGTNVGLWQMRDMDPLPTWTNSRVLLVGDAAHPMLPHQAQGACQAIEDAEAVGAFLRGTTAATAPAALRRVFRVRFRRVSRVQAASRANGLRNVKGTSHEGFEKAWAYYGAERWEKEMAEDVLSEEEEGKMAQGL